MTYLIFNSCIYLVRIYTFINLCVNRDLDSHYFVYRHDALSEYLHTNAGCSHTAKLLIYLTNC